MIKKSLLSTALVAAVGLCTLGCSGSSNGNPPVAGVAPTATSGIVGQLTGDPDDQVDPALQDLVEQAIALDETDEPLDF